MIYDVLVTQEANERYTARVLALPDIVVSGTDEQEVLHQVQAAIAHLLNKSRLVRLSSYADRQGGRPLGTCGWHVGQRS